MMKTLLFNREEQGVADRNKTKTWRRQKARTSQTLDGLTTLRGSTGKTKGGYPCRLLPGTGHVT